MGARSLAACSSLHNQEGVPFERRYGVPIRSRLTDRLGLEDVHAFQVHLMATGISWPALNQIATMDPAAPVRRPRNRRLMSTVVVDHASPDLLFHDDPRQSSHAILIEILDRDLARLAVRPTRKVTPICAFGASAMGAYVNTSRLKCSSGKRLPAGPRCRKSDPPDSVTWHCPHSRCCSLRHMRTPA